MSKPGRNDPCSCGSGKKYKKCCELKVGHRKFVAEKIVPNMQKASGISSLFNRKITPIAPPKEESKSSEEILDKPKEQKEFEN